jgi:arylsulfatase A-like enzyme
MLARLRVLYDRSVRHLDAQLGEFFQQLRRRHLYDDSLVIVTSDHGEAFREHGSFLHSQTYDETLAVPLLVKLPSRMGAARGGERAVGLATLEDVAPTILDVLGLPVPDTVQGVSLLPLLLRDEPVRQQVVSQDKRRRSRHALVADGHKLIYDFEDGSAELYDLAADPLETRDLAAAQPQRTAALQRQLALRVRENTRLAEQFRAAAPDGVLSADERKALRAIGYVEE